MNKGKEEDKKKRNSKNKERSSKSKGNKEWNKKDKHTLIEILMSKTYRPVNI